MTANSDFGFLEGTVVLDLTRYLSGPYCTMLLGDWGAEVIKIEKPGGGDPTRSMPEADIDRSLYFDSVNRNKRSVVLDLAAPGGRAVMERLTQAADVVVLNHTKASIDSLGLDYATLRGYRSDLVYCNISGFGLDSNRTGPAFDLLIQALSGVMSLTGEGDRQYRVGVPIADLAGGLFATIAVIGGLLQRSQTTDGCYVDISMLDSLTSLLGHHAARYLATGAVPKPQGVGHPTNVPIGAFETLDQRKIVIDCPTDAFFRRAALAFGHPEWAFSETYGSPARRLANRHELERQISQIIKTKTLAEWADVFDAHGVPAAPIRRLDDALDAPELQRMIWDVPSARGGSFRALGNPLRPQKSSISPPPELGADTDDVLSGCGYSLSEIQDLRREGVVQ